VEEFSIVLNQVTVLFIILVIGFTAGKFKILDSVASKNLAAILLYVTSPMMVLNSFFIEFSKEKVINIIWVVSAAMVMFLISIVMSQFIFKGFNEKIEPILKFTTVFSNCGYMGLPLLKALFGENGVFYGSFYNVIFNIVLWSYGFMMFGGKGTKRQIAKRVLTNPSIIAVYIGLIIFLTGIPVHNNIKAAISAVGDMTMPIAMLIIGGVISTAKFTKIFTDWRVYLSSGIRLLLMPALAAVLFRIAHVPSLPGAIVVASIAMPAATVTTIFSEMFDKDAVFSSKCVAISTLLSIITAPAVISIMVKGLL
jgi:predicted permease